MPYARVITPEQAADMIERRAAGESYVTIGKAHKRSHTAVSRLLKHKDYAPILADAVAARAAIEGERDEAVARDHTGALDRERQKRASARKKAAAFGVPPERVDPDFKGKRADADGMLREHRRESADGRVLGVCLIPTPADAERGVRAKYTHFDTEGPHEIREEEWRRAEREVAPSVTAVAVHYHGTRGPGIFGYDVLDVRELSRAADLLIDEGIGTPKDRHALISRLSKVKPGSKIELRYEEPEPTEDDEPGEDAPLFTADMLVEV